MVSGAKIRETTTVVDGTVLFEQEGDCGLLGDMVATQAEEHQKLEDTYEFLKQLPLEFQDASGAGEAA